MLPTEIFLSHSDQDRQFVEELVDMMRRHGLRVWYSRSNVLGGQQWHDEIGEAILRCDWFVLVLSPNAVGSTWVKKELMFSFHLNHFENKMIPLLHQPCNYGQLSWTLFSIQLIDFTQTFEQGCRDLLRVWNLRYQAA